MPQLFSILVLGLSQMVILLIGLYQRLFFWRTPCCRFYPSCSAYALAAFQRYSLERAAALTLRRLCSCHPLHRGGYDPLPE